jgi:hypothetical protein
LRLAPEAAARSGITVSTPDRPVQAVFLNGSDSSASGEDDLLQGPGRCPP